LSEPRCPGLEDFQVSSAVYSNWESGKRDPSFLVVQKLFEMGASVEELFGVQYSNITPPSLEGIKISREQAAEIVKAGMYAIMGNSGIVQNTNVLKED